MSLQRISLPDESIQIKLQLIRELFKQTDSRSHRLLGRGGGACSSQFENTYLTEMCSSVKAGSYLRLVDFVYLKKLGVIKKKRKKQKKLGGNKEEEEEARSLGGGKR